MTKGICMDNIAMGAEMAFTDQLKNSVCTAFSSTSTPTTRYQQPLESSCSTHVTGVQNRFTRYKQIPDSENRIHLVNNTGINMPDLDNMTLPVRITERNARTSWFSKPPCIFQPVISIDYGVSRAGNRFVLFIMIPKQEAVI